jgi:large subunit ribosomal protein L6
MSRIGKKPIEVPKNVKLYIDHTLINVEGPKGKLSFRISPRVTAVMKDNIVLFDRVSNQKKDGALQGTARSVVANMIEGVTNGFTKELNIEGVGFKAALQGKSLNLALGFTHPVIFEVPEGLTVETPKPTIIIIKGADKVSVGHFAAKIRKVYPAEPYKGKGVRYAGEQIRRKAGKTVTK